MKKTASCLLFFPNQCSLSERALHLKFQKGKQGKLFMHINPTSLPMNHPRENSLIVTYEITNRYRFASCFLLLSPLL